jgi:hypothetical protein
VRDKCYALSAGATVDLDLTDPTPSDCRILIFPITTKVRSAPIDETMPPPVIGAELRRSGCRRLIATVRCDRAAPKACAGVLTAEPARGGKRIARAAYRVPAGRSRTVSLIAGAAALRAVQAARVTAVGRGVSRRGPTTVIALRPVR